MPYRSFAQINLIGSVNDEDGKSIPFAFIKEPKHSNATFSDASGNFVLKVADPGDGLTATAVNYNGVMVKVDNPQATKIILAGNGGTTPDITYGTDAFKENLSTQGITRNAGSQYIAAEKGLHGSRYLFNNWVHGFVVNLEDSIQQQNNLRYNYAKVEGTLLYTEDGKTIKQFDGRQIKSFTIFNDEGQAYVFESVPEINTNHFVQVLASGSKYKIYKLLLTKFKPADYVSNGMTSTGTTYDEFLDETTYYVVKGAKGQPQKLQLKKKAIKIAFTEEADKVTKFASAHDADDIDDKYLKQLGDELNK